MRESLEREVGRQTSRLGGEEYKFAMKSWKKVTIVYKSSHKLWLCATG